MAQYNAQEIEPKILKFWEDAEIYEKSVERNKGKKLFNYLDGPPYTTGKIHVGHAWGKALRDAILRYKRMKGFQVWDKPGFDMHGLPIEVKVEKKLGMNDKREIEKFGVQKFVDECKQFALDNLWPMVEDFKRIGVWLNWKHPYMTIDKSYVEGTWWALAQAHKKGYLYKGKKAMTWCARCATALAKHELEYENKTDDSIFVKMPIKGKENEYLIIWTTTPWTIPFNMAIMAHPDFNYVKAEIEDTGEKWILAEALAGGVIGAVADKKYKVLKTFKGSELEGTQYKHPFEEEVEYQKTIGQKEPRAHTVVMSEQYVTLDAGTGLVHCAPGCGPEDFEVGKENGISPYNELDEHGYFPESMGPLAGLHAKDNNSEFIEKLNKKGLLVESTKVEHEYAHCWRCKTPVLFRATDQWFLATEKVRERMRELNKKLNWVPEWGGSRWFDSWLSNLQDWCISRQRFWGVPLPIWENNGDYIVVESAEELEKLSGKKLEDLHRPWVDEVTIEKNGKKYTRVPDILDVWFDSAAAPWASVGYPENKELFEKLGFPDLVLEGKDQIRGWFSGLMGMAVVSFDEAPYKAVYMHGFINDAMGRKMSKSLGNIISPYEVIDTTGADTLRYYTIGGANPGVDLNYNPEDAKTKLKNLTILWNIHNFVLDLAKELKVNPTELDDTVMKNMRDNEERYMFSRLHSNTKQATEMFDAYEIQKVPKLAEDIILCLSRDYLQQVREKTEDEQKKLVLYTAYKVLEQTLKLFAPIAPFITEQIWLNFKNEFKLEEQSIHLCEWPDYDEKEIDLRLEDDMTKAKNVIQASLSAREKAKLGVRWPVKEIEVVVNKEEDLESIARVKEIIQRQVNCKQVNTSVVFPHVREELKINVGMLGKEFGAKAPAIQKELNAMEEELIIKQLKKANKVPVEVDNEQYELSDLQLQIVRKVPERYIEAETPIGEVYLNVERTDELEAEGYAREIMRRVQALRKKAGLIKSDNINLYIHGQKEDCEMLDKVSDKIRDKCGASQFKTVTTEPVKKHEHQAEEKIKDKKFTIYLDKIE